MSTCEAELIALADCAIELVYILRILKDLQFEPTGPVSVYTDSQAAFNLCNRTSACGNSKHINRKTFKMRELNGAGKVHLKKIETNNNWADLYTKVFTRQLFETLRSHAVCSP